MFDVSQLDLTGLETRYKLKPGLLKAVMHAESAGNPGAVSPKGARGLFQFMPDTAQAYGIDPDDPHQAADGAARMFADLSKQFNGDVPQMLAGYNWGSGNLTKHGLDKAPEETRNYIAKIVPQLEQASTTSSFSPPPQTNLSAMTLPDDPAGGLSFDDLIPPPANQNGSAAPAAAALDFEDLIPPPVQTPPGMEPMPPIGADNRPSFKPKELTPKQKMQKTGRSLQIGTQGVGRGVADIAGMPVDLATAGLNLAKTVPNLFGAEIPSITDPVGGSDWLARQAGNVSEAAGMEPIPAEEMNTGERLGYNVNRFGTAAIAGGAGLAQAAEKKAATALPSMADAWLEAYRANPEKALAMDAVAGAGAGAGHTVAETYAPGNPWAALTADITGGMTAAGLAHGVEGGVRGMQNFGRSMTDGFSIDKNIKKDPISNMPVGKKAADEAARHLQQHAENLPEAAKSLETNSQFYQENNLPMPGTGALSNDVGMIGVERTARQMDPTPFLKRDRAVREAQGDLVKNAVPEMPEDQKGLAQVFAKQTAGDMRTEAKTAAQTAQDELLAGKSNLTASQQAEAVKAAPVAAARGTEGQASQALDQGINEGALQPRTAAKNQAFDAIDPEGAIKRDATPLLETARAIKAQIGKLSPESSGVPAEFMQKLERLAPDEVITETGLLDDAGNAITHAENAGGDGQLSIKDMMDARKYLNTAAEKAQQGGNFDLASNVRKLKGQINDELDQIIAEGGPGSAEAATAKQAYQEEYAPYFAEGFGRLFRDKIQKDPTGRTALPPSQTADFFLKSSPEAAKDLKRIASISQDPAGTESAVGNYMKAQLSQLVKSDGTMEPATVKKWLDNNRDTLGQFPTVQKEMEGVYRDVLNGRTQTNKAAQQVQELATRHKASEANVTATERRINDSVLSTLMDNAPENAAAKILADGDPQARMKETIVLLEKNPGAKEAFKRAVADHLEKQFTGARTELTSGEDYAVLQSKLESYMKKPGVEKALNDLYADTPNAMVNLKMAQRIGRDLAKVNIQATAGSPTVENAARVEKFLNPIELVLRPIFGQLETGGKMRQLRLAMNTIPGLNNAAAVQRLIVRAQLEPDLALHLYGREASKMPPALWSKKLNRLLGYADAARTSASSEEQEKSNKKK